MADPSTLSPHELAQHVAQHPLHIAGLLDYALLKPTVTKEAIVQFCQDAQQYSFSAVSVNPTHIRHVAKLVAGSGLKVCAVIGFPLGASTTQAKAIETEQALKAGASEIEMVLNIGAVKSGDDGFTRAQFTAVAKLAHRYNATCKIILETSYLTNEEKVRVCQIAQKVGVDFIQTATGFNGTGATVEDVALIRHTVGPEMGVKASGGIRSFESAYRLLAAGANRIGSSAGLQIMQEAQINSLGDTEIVRVAEAVLYVSDIERAKQFYTQVLGLPISAEFEGSLFLQTGQNSNLILFDLAHLQTRISVIPSHGAHGRGHACLAIPHTQMQRWRERLLAHNVPIEHEQDWPQGTHSIYFRDPDNNSLELMDGRHYQYVWQRLQDRKNKPA